jgi:hypothetical protein
MRKPKPPATDNLGYAAALAAAKDRAARARIVAQRADPPLSVLIDRWWAETLLAADGQPTPTAAEMLRRIAIMLEVLADRGGRLSGRMR